MKILVTGGAGFIGSHVTDLLCKKKHSVVVIDDLRFGYRKFVNKEAKFIQGSIANTLLLEKALDGIDVVMHLAASSIIEYSYSNPIEYYQNNVMNGLLLLEAMRKKKVKKIIFSSTSSLYGNPKNTPIHEDALPDPLNAYSSSKLSFEYTLRAYYHSYGIQSSSLRYYNVYGPRDEQIPRSRAIPMWIEAILANRPIPWYWQGKQKRDYVYVEDIAEAHIKVINLPKYNYFNLGSGEGIYMKNVLKTLEKVVGYKLKTIDMGERKGDPMISFSDISKIKKSVGWIPKTSLEVGLKKTFEYYKSKCNGKN